MIRILFFIFLTSLIISSCGNHHVLSEVKKLDHYPSASAIEYYNKQFWVMGDDANNMLILDSNLAITDSLSLYSFKERRIPKSVKPDLEAMAILRENGKTNFMIFGSGSLAPYRNTAVFLDPLTRQTDSTRLDIFFNRLLSNGIKEVNIEGACSIPGFVLLSNRGNRSHPKNHLLFVKTDFWKNQSMTPITTVLLGSMKDSIFNGVSGMSYAPRSDKLVVTVSTEDTYNAHEDGAIGKSYLWIVKNISAKRNWKAINPDQVIDLDELDDRFKGQKIESVCIVKETNRNLHLVLAADNDDGSSTLFRLVVEIK